MLRSAVRSVRVVKAAAAVAIPTATAVSTTRPRRAMSSMGSLLRATATASATSPAHLQPIDLQLVAPKGEASGTAVVTTLDNGVRVASLESATPAAATLAVHINAGSRASKKNTGVSQFAARSAFLSSRSRSDYGADRDISAIGAKVDATSTRASNVYYGTGPVDSASDLLAILADTVHNSRYRKQEVVNIQGSYALEVAAAETNRDIQLDDALHAAAYNNNTYGFPHSPTTSQLDKLDTYALHHYTDAFYTPQRMTVVGYGVPHDQLVRAAKELFSDSAFQGRSPVDIPAPQYTGGDVRVPQRGAQCALAIGFKNAVEGDKSWAALRVLQMWLEGPRLSTLAAFGGASSGGVAAHLVQRPYISGRLQTNPQVSSIGHIGSRFVDGGVWALGGVLNKANAAPELVNYLVRAYKEAAGGGLTSDVLPSVKALAVAELYYDQSAASIVDTLAQQVLAGATRSTAQSASEIEAVTEADVASAAKKLLTSPLSVAAFGDISYMPRYDEIKDLFSK